MDLIVSGAAPSCPPGFFSLSLALSIKFSTGTKGYTSVTLKFFF